MLLSEFRKLIDTIFNRAVREGDELTKIMTPAEFFAYDVVSRIQEDNQMRIDLLETLIESGGFDEDTAMYCLTDHKEFIDAYLSGKTEIMENPETPPEIEMKIEVDKEI